MKRAVSAAVLLFVFGLQSGYAPRGESPRPQAGSLQPWGSDNHPADEARSHLERITGRRHAYTVVQGGSMDGENCRTPQGSWIPFVQTWESNRSVRIENEGETDLINPWLSNGRNNFRNIGEIISQAVRPGMSDREKAIALWVLQTNHVFHAWTGDDETMDPVKLFNVYGYATCGHSAPNLAGMWKRAGLRISPGRAVGHVVPQVFFDGSWHLLDADMQAIYLGRDNHTIAGEREIARDHDLIKRTHAEGLLLPDGRPGNEWQASLFVYEGEPYGTYDCSPRHTMDMILRPSEAITWRWGQRSPLRYHGTAEITDWGQAAADTIRNGLWEYRPDLSGTLWREGADSVQNVRVTAEGLAAEPGRTGTVVWSMRSPYVFVGGRLVVDGAGARFFVSWDGESWEEAGADLDGFFPQRGPARYDYRLKCELSGEARLRELQILNDLQMAPLALPGMTVGENRFIYTDDSPGMRAVRITHEWVERSASRPPGAPPAPVFPPDGGETDGTDIVFEWSPPGDPDGDAIADYQFELSEYPDMRWPLSSNFRKLVSLTADRGEARYTLPLAGLLAPDREYYWRTRARDSQGVWGPWSRPWRFVPRAAAPPVNVALEFDGESGVGTLRWEPNPAGRRPVKYRVYGSDEKGFSVSDEPYPVMDLFAGDWRNARLAGRFQANFVAETSDTRLVVLRQGSELPNSNRAFYRVVALDGSGKRSWSSDYASAPRPFIYTTPIRTAKVGEPYRHQVNTIRSLGDLSLRTVTEEQVPVFWPPGEVDAILKGPEWYRQVVNFWDIQTPVYALVEGPHWLGIDAATGLLTGTPQAPGRVRVVVSAALEREVDELDLEALVWGRREVRGRTTERMGPVFQEFVVDVTN